MKKRILFCHWNMVIGGIETALVNLLKRIDPNQFEVDLLLEDKRGEFLKLIPSYVNVFDSASIGLLHGNAKKALLHELKSFKLLSASKVFYYWLKKDKRRFDCFYNNIPQLKYDIAISYSMHSYGLMRLVNDYVEAPLKMVFVHNDPVMNAAKPGTVTMDDRIKCIDNFNYIFGVSQSVTDNFAKLFPQYADRCQTIYNFMDIDRFMKMADEGAAKEMETDGIKVLSVGRFTNQKNFTVVPAVCEELKKKNLDFKWYIVGDGDERAYTEKLIAEKNLQDTLFLLGAKSNPYPYYKAADVYCQPSLSEAYCITIAEARIFNVPIVATKFPGISEQLTNNNPDSCGGFIVENNPEAIAEGIVKIIEATDKERKDMLAVAAYPNGLEKALEKKFFELIGQR